MGYRRELSATKEDASCGFSFRLVADRLILLVDSILIPFLVTRS
jgi:hypothetical protein